jgi:predicted permease
LVNQTLESYLVTAAISLALISIGISAQSFEISKPIFYAINKLVLWVMLPAVVFISIAWQSLTDIIGLAPVVALAFVGFGICFFLAIAASSMMHVDKKMAAAVAMNSAFMNVTYLGLPVVYAIFGTSGAMAAASIYAMIIGVFHLTLGVAFVTSSTGKKVSARSISYGVLTFPAAFVLIIALLFVGLRGVPPIAIRTPLDYIAKPSFALMLLLVGYQMPLVNPRKYASALTVTGAIRLLICPLITYICIILFGLSATAPFAKTALIMAAMPPAVFNVYLAHNFKLDLKLYGTIVLYLTFISLFLALPLMMIILGF